MTHPRSEVPETYQVLRLGADGWHSIYQSNDFSDAIWFATHRRKWVGRGHKQPIVVVRVEVIDVGSLPKVE